MRRFEPVAAIELPVGEAKRILERLESLKTRKSLDGGQRQLLDDTRSAIEYSIDTQVEGVVQVPGKDIRNVLRLFAESQEWFFDFG